MSAHVTNRLSPGELRRLENMLFNQSHEQIVYEIVDRQDRYRVKLQLFMQVEQEYQVLKLTLSDIELKTHGLTVRRRAMIKELRRLR